MLPITAIYASLLALLIVGLALRVPFLRRREKVGIGDGGNPDLALRIRVHANAVEYVPMALILMGIYELNVGAPALLHVFGGILLVSRLGHAWGLSQSSGRTPGRFLGAVGTVLVTIGLALANLIALVQ